MVGAFFNLFHSQNDWQYRTEPGQNYCLSSRNSQCYWPRGKTLGGSSSINAMFYVRGHREDFNEWNNMGNEGWSYEEVLPYFKKSQALHDNFISEDEKLKFHNEDGLLNVGRHTGSHNLSNVILNAYKEIGVPIIQDLSGKDTVGALKTLATAYNGRRQSTARAFLTPARERNNLFVLKKTLVTKIIFKENSKVAMGIEVQKDTEINIIKVRKEVILSAGAINSPQLLMLSGIGPRDHLEEMGIDIVEDLPVGLNLQDHVVASNLINLNIDMLPLDKETYSVFMTEFVTKQTGFFTNLGPTEVISFINVFDLYDTVPNIQYHHILLPPKSKEILDIYKAHEYDDDTLNIIYELNEQYPLLLFLSVLLKPNSLGVIKLKSKDPYEKPLINANYFDDAFDVETIVQSMEFVSNLTETFPLKQFNATLVRLPLTSCEGFSFKSKEYFECVARHLTSTLYHPVGTVKMGPYEDVTSVVGPDLKVHGMLNLRVADASIMPRIVRANTNAATIMIGEKVSDMIKDYWESD